MIKDYLPKGLDYKRIWPTSGVRQNYYKLRFELGVVISRVYHTFFFLKNLSFKNPSLEYSVYFK